MRKSSAAPIVAAQATASENQFWARVDREGYVVGGFSTRQKPEGLGFLGFLDAMRHRYPLDPADIIGGDALTMLELEQMAEAEDARRTA